MLLLLTLYSSKENFGGECCNLSAINSRTLPVTVYRFGGLPQAATLLLTVGGMGKGRSEWGSTS